MAEFETAIIDIMNGGHAYLTILERNSGNLKNNKIYKIGGNSFKYNETLDIFVIKKHGNFNKEEIKFINKSAKKRALEERREEANVVEGTLLQSEPEPEPEPVYHAFPVSEPETKPEERDLVAEQMQSGHENDGTGRYMPGLDYLTNVRSNRRRRTSNRRRRTSNRSIPDCCGSRPREESSMKKKKRKKQTRRRKSKPTNKRKPKQTKKYKRLR